MKSEGKKFEVVLPEAGHYPSRCMWIIDLGTQEKEFKGEKSHSRQVKFGFELLGTSHIFNEEKGPQPFMISQDFTNSIGKKANLGKFLSSWRNKKITDQEEKDGIDLFKMFGNKAAWIIISIERSKNGNDYTKINSISPVPPKEKDAVATMACENPVIMFEIGGICTVDGVTVPWQKVFDSLPKYIKGIIAKSPEYVEANGGTAYEEVPMDATVKQNLNRKDEF